MVMILQYFDSIDSKKSCLYDNKLILTFKIEEIVFIII